MMSVFQSSCHSYPRPTQKLYLRSLGVKIIPGVSHQEDFTDAVLTDTIQTGCTNTGHIGDKSGVETQEASVFLNVLCSLVLSSHGVGEDTVVVEKLGIAIVVIKGKSQGDKVAKTKLRSDSSSIVLSNDNNTVAQESNEGDKEG